MNMATKKQCTKDEYRALLDAVSQAYENELGEALGEVERAFKAWRQGQVLASAVNDAIHDFHQHAARDLYSLYNDLPPDTLACSAVERGYLQAAELPASVREKLARHPSWPK